MIVGNSTVGMERRPFVLKQWYLEKLQIKVGIVATGYKSNGSSPKVVDELFSNIGDEAIGPASMTRMRLLLVDSRAKSSLF